MSDIIPTNQNRLTIVQHDVSEQSSSNIHEKRSNVALSHNIKDCKEGVIINLDYPRKKDSYRNITTIKENLEKIFSKEIPLAEKLEESLKVAPLDMRLYYPNDGLLASRSGLLLDNRTNDMTLVYVQVANNSHAVISFENIDENQSLQLKDIHFKQANIASLDISSLKFHAQYIPQYGGAIIDSTTQVITTTSISGCSFFMCKVAEKMLCFHINALNSNCTKPECYDVVSLNILAHFLDVKHAYDDNLQSSFNTIKDLYKDTQFLKLNDQKNALEIQLEKLRNLIDSYANNQSFKNDPVILSSLMNMYTTHTRDLTQINKELYQYHELIQNKAQGFKESINKFLNNNQKLICNQIDSLFKSITVNFDNKVQEDDYVRKFSCIISVPKYREILSGGHYVS